LSSERERALIPVLLGLTFVTGVIDAVSVLGLGRVFTANMTGNVVFLGFATAGIPGLSVWRAGVALASFWLGALAGGRIGRPISTETWRVPVAWALGVETALLLVAAATARGSGANLEDKYARLYMAIVLTGVAMGLRNAVVRKLAIPDLTTTVLTLTITGLAADSALAGGEGPRWGRRIASVALVLAGAAVGASLVKGSVAVALAVAA
jgi:uncharacterized membrane protein YoaK (UPF0700 family)